MSKSTPTVGQFALCVKHLIATGAQHNQVAIQLAHNPGVETTRAEAATEF
jgi:hypothetical protein